MSTQNATPDATATPRTDADKLATELIVWSSLPLGAGINQYEFSRVAREAAKLLRELTAAKAEIALAKDDVAHQVSVIAKLDADNAELRAEVGRLKHVASWAQATLTALNVGDVASGSALHLKLRDVMIQSHPNQAAPVAEDAAETDREISELIQERDQAEEAADKMASEVLGEAIDWPFHDAAWQRAIDEAGEMRRELYMRRNSPLIAERDQLRARVAELESQLSASATKAASEYGEQLKPLFAKVRELEADKARLDWLLSRGVCWRGCDTELHREGWTVGHETEWLYDLQGQGRARIDKGIAARAGKGAT